MLENDRMMLDFGPARELGKSHIDIQLSIQIDFTSQ